VGIWYPVLWVYGISVVGAVHCVFGNSSLQTHWQHIRQEVVTNYAICEVVPSGPFEGHHYQVAIYGGEPMVEHGMVCGTG